MIRSRTPVVLATIIIWAIIFCIYYLGKSSRDVKTEPVVLSNTAAVKSHEENLPQDKKVAVKETPKEKPKETAKTKEKEDEEIAQPDFKGEIKQGKLCLDTLNHFKAGEEAGLWECHGEGRNQYWFRTKQHLLRNDQLCIQAPADADGKKTVSLMTCDNKVKEQQWIYKSESLMLKGTNNCLETVDGKKLRYLPCNAASKSQKYEMKSVGGDLAG